MLQAAVLILELLESLRLAHRHAAVLRLPAVDRVFRDGMLARQVGHLRPGLSFLQDPDDLSFRESAPLHHSSNPAGGLRF